MNGFFPAGSSIPSIMLTCFMIGVIGIIIFAILNLKEVKQHGIIKG